MIAPGSSFLARPEAGIQSPRRKSSGLTISVPLDSQDHARWSKEYAPTRWALILKSGRFVTVFLFGPLALWITFLGYHWKPPVAASRFGLDYGSCAGTRKKASHDVGEALAESKAFS